MIKFNFEISLPKVEVLKWWQLLISVIVLIGIMFGYITFDDILEFVKSKLNRLP